MATTLDEKGNAIVNGYSTNLPPNQVISSATLAPSAPLTLQSTPVDNTNYAGTTNTITSQIANEYAQVDKQLSQAQSEQKNAAQGQLDIMAQLTGRTAYQQQADEATGVNTETDALNKYNQQLAKINAEASSLNREAQAIPIQDKLAYQGTAGTQAGVDSVSRDRLSQNALKALSLGQQADIAAAAATGSALRLQAAKDKAQQIVDLKYKPLEQELEIKKTNYELNKDILSQIDKKRSEALGLVIKKEETELAEKKAREKEIDTLIIDATPFAPADVIARVNDIKARGGTATQIAQALGVYGKDYLQNEALKTNIAKAKLDMVKTNAEIDKIRSTTEGTNITGKPLKVSNAEITNLNEALTAKASVQSLVDQFKTNITTYGTQTLFGKAAGDREALRTNLLLAIKNMEKTGALDAGTIAVLEGTIPSSKLFATQSAQLGALNTLMNTINSKTDSYINSYKGTSAETDPRTKRAYETTPVVSTGNKQADEYFLMTSGALNKSITETSTPAMSAGYVDNQAK